MITTVSQALIRGENIIKMICRRRTLQGCRETEPHRPTYKTETQQLNEDLHHLVRHWDGVLNYNMVSWQRLGYLTFPLSVLAVLDSRPIQPHQFIWFKMDLLSGIFIRHDSHDLY